MKPHIIFIVLLLIMAFFLTFAVEADGNPKLEVPWEVNCQNVFRGDGFMDRGYCVPGQISSKTQFTQSPTRFYGVGSSYAPGIMEWMCEKNGGCKGYKDGLTVMSCGDIGRTAWIKVSENRPWYGPLKVVDCSQPFHAYVNVVELGLAAEWGAKTAEVLNVKVSSAVLVHLGDKPNNSNWGWYYRTWWIENALEWKEFDLRPPWYYTGFRNIAILP